MRGIKIAAAIKSALHGLAVVTGAAALAAASFLVLPLMQTIAKPPAADLLVLAVDTAELPPPPPPPPEEKPEEEPEPEEQSPELMEEAPPLDLAQLELVLDPGFGESWMGGDFAIKLNTMVAGGGEVEELFSPAELDQEPRAVYQPSPVLTAKIRKKAPGTVYVLFVVDERGRVENPIVQKSTDPIFDQPALAAVQQWKFDPGKRNGRAVRFRMRVPVTFPEER